MISKPTEMTETASAVSVIDLEPKVKRNLTAENAKGAKWIHFRLKAKGQGYFTAELAEIPIRRFASNGAGAEKEPGGQWAVGGRQRALLIKAP